MTTCTSARPGDWTTYQIAEVPPTEFEALGVPANWKEAIAKDSIGICVFARGAGEGNTYKPGSALNYAGEATGEDPLKLSADELAVVEAAKATCSKVIVLLNTGNNMMIADIAEGGSHEVDGICYIGCPNDYQTIGIANVLTGKVNATGALASAFVRDHQSIPAVQNVGGDYFADYEIVCRNDDPRYPGKEIGNIGTGSFGGADTYNGACTSSRRNVSTSATSTTKPVTLTPSWVRATPTARPAQRRAARGITATKCSTPLVMA